MSLISGRGSPYFVSTASSTYCMAVFSVGDLLVEAKTTTLNSVGRVPEEQRGDRRPVQTGAGPAVGRYAEVLRLRIVLQPRVVGLRDVLGEPNARFEVGDPRELALANLRVGLRAVLLAEDVRDVHGDGALVERRGRVGE